MPVLKHLPGIHLVLSGQPQQNHLVDRPVITIRESQQFVAALATKS